MKPNLLRLLFIFTLAALLAALAAPTAQAQALYNLSYSATTGGRIVTAEPQGLRFPHLVSFTAEADPGYGFTNWSVSGSYVKDPTQATIMFQLSADTSLGANFAPLTPTIDVGKKGNPGERFTATGGSYLLSGTASSVNQIQWNLPGGPTHKVAVSGAKWSVKISPLKKGANKIQISGWNTITNKGSKPLKITITRK
jgi:hypothetical protein